MSVTSVQPSRPSARRAPPSPDRSHMKSPAIVICTVVLAACVTPNRAVIETEAVPTSLSANARESAEAHLATGREIVRLQEAWVQAAVDSDADAFAQFMDDNYRVVSRGRVRDKATWVESIRSGQATYQAVQYRNVDVNVYGDTVAVISGEYAQKATAAGQDNSKPGVFVATWAKRDGEWRAVASIYP